LKALGQLRVEMTPGGIPVLVDGLPWSRSAAVAVNLSVGSRDEPSDRHGIAHLLEHVLFKGTSQHTSRQMSQEIEAAGGEMNGYTTKEMTSYYVSTLDETLGTAQDLLSEIVREPLLDTKDIETEKKVVTQEIRMSEDDPDNYSHELLMKKVWKGNPMSDPEAGYVECVEALDRESVGQFFGGFYRPPNMVVVASGNVEAKQIVEWASRSFDGLQNASMQKKRTMPAFKPGIHMHPREGDQAYVAIGFPAVDARHNDRYAHGLVGGVLAAGTSSRLYQKVREENGLVYSIYSMTYAFTDAGMTGLFFSTSTENTQKVLRMVAEELALLKKEGLENGELDRAKRWIKGMFVRRLESSAENRMFFLGESYLQFGRPTTGDEVLGKIESVTEDDALRVARKMLDREKMGLVLYMEQRPGKKVAKNLQSLDF
jgi:predicted Zn-dependent peptidase